MPESEPTITQSVGDGHAPTVSRPAAPHARQALPWSPIRASGPTANWWRRSRRRLRQVVLVFLAAYAAFLLRDTLSPRREGLYFQKFMFLVVTPVQLALAAVTWSSWANSIRRLRTIELAMLAVFVGTVGSIQFDWLSNWRGLDYYVHGEHATDGQIMVGNTWVIPWFALIAGYPVIIPNSPRRALTVALLMAILPYLITLFALTVSRRIGWAETWMMFIQFTIWCPIAVGLAVYGAHQAGMLRRQAYEARRFGQYRLAHRLGSGGMGEVYLAEHLLLRRPSVIKVIRREHARDPAVLKRFEREVQILATLNHWNTVAVFDYGHTADGTFYYVMEYLPGLNLDELVKQHGPLTPARVVHLLRQLCAALNEAHAAGLIHRDVKPSNVMVCRRGGVADVVKLLDFGLVVGAESTTGSGPKLTMEGAILGTPHFMSPEQAAGKADRLPQRHLLARGDGVLPAERQAAVLGPGDGGDRRAPDAGPDAADGGEARRAGRPGGGRDAVPGEEARGAVRDRWRNWTRPWRRAAGERLGCRAGRGVVGEAGGLAATRSGSRRRAPLRVAANPVSPDVAARYSLQRGGTLIALTSPLPNNG